MRNMKLKVVAVVLCIVFVGGSIGLNILAKTSPDNIRSGESHVASFANSTIPGEWIEVSEGLWWYRHYDGTYTQNNWEYIDGEWYYFDGDGWMVIGWLNLNGTWYYLSPDSGAMATDWRNIDGKWYYFYEDGAMNTVNMTDTKYGNSRTLYFANNGQWLYTTSLITWDLVDSGKHLDWDGDTKYSNYVTMAVNTWNNYKSGVIREDTILVEQDVWITDCNCEDETFMGRTYDSGKIVLNVARLDEHSTNEKLNTIIHELGHALRLGHNDDDTIMYEYNQDLITLSISDKESYDEAYNEY